MSPHAAECDEVLGCAGSVDHPAEGNDRAGVAPNVTILMLIMEHAATVMTTTTISLAFPPGAFAWPSTAQSNL